MLRIRLRRVGKKKQPMYRIVVADSRAPRDGGFVENIGQYRPLATPSTIVIDADRARHWLDRGAQPSDRVAKLLAIQGIAEIPPKLQTRIELGKKRAAEAAKAKPKAETGETAEPAAEASVNEDAPKDKAPTEEDAPKDEAPTKQDAPKDEAPTKEDAPKDEAPPADDKPAEGDAPAPDEKKTEA